MKNILFLSLLLVTLNAGAGGDAWSFAPVLIEFNDEGDFTLRLARHEAESIFPKTCDKIEVAGGFSSFKWFFFGDDGLTKDNHMRALAFIKKEIERSRPINFGEVGRGLLISAENPCKATSKGLFLDNDGTVYSYYKWP